MHLLWTPRTCVWHVRGSFSHNLCMFSVSARSYWICVRANLIIVSKALWEMFVGTRRVTNATYSLSGTDSDIARWFCVIYRFDLNNVKHSMQGNEILKKNDVQHAMFVINVSTMHQTKRVLYNRFDNIFVKMSVKIFVKMFVKFSLNCNE